MAGAARPDERDARLRERRQARAPLRDPRLARRQIGRCRNAGDLGAAARAAGCPWDNAGRNPAAPRRAPPPARRLRARPSRPTNSAGTSSTTLAAHAGDEAAHSGRIGWCRRAPARHAATRSCPAADIRRATAACPDRGEARHAAARKARLVLLEAGRIVAERQARERGVVGRIRIGGVAREHRLEARDRLGVPVERLQRHAAVELRRAVERPLRQRPVIGRDRIGVAAEPRERKAAVEMQLRAAPDAPPAAHHIAPAPPRTGPAWRAHCRDCAKTSGAPGLSRQRRLDQRQRRARIAALQLDDAEEVQRLVAVGHDLRRRAASFSASGNRPLWQCSIACANMRASSGDGRERGLAMGRKLRDAAPASRAGSVSRPACGERATR